MGIHWEYMGILGIHWEYMGIRGNTRIPRHLGIHGNTVWERPVPYSLPGTVFILPWFCQFWETNAAVCWLLRKLKLRVYTVYTSLHVAGMWYTYIHVVYYKTVRVFTTVVLREVSVPSKVGLNMRTWLRYTRNLTNYVDVSRKKKCFFHF